MVQSAGAFGYNANSRELALKIILPMAWLRTLFGLAAAAGLALSIGTTRAAEDDDLALGLALTPPGITLQVLGKGQGYDLGKQSAAALPRDEIAFADAKGMTLYTSRKDPTGQSACLGSCAKTWVPLAAPENAQVFGRWSVISREDGLRQWAYKGKPLYSYIKDVDPGSVGGNSPARFGARRRNGAGAFVGGGVRGSGAKGASPDLALPAEWRVALAYPVADIKLPAGIGVKEVADAGGLMLVDWRNRTLYARDTLDSGCAQPCIWQPVAAPQLAEITGSFSVVERGDGIKQWAFKGRPLFTYAGDLAPGDANGAGIDSHFSTAAVFAFFRPAGVTLHKTLGQGYVLAAASGLTLYRRDGYIFQSGGGHSLHRGQPPRPAVGRDIGINAHCDGDCAKVWHPLRAPADAEPQGFWSIATRDDGSKQWVYQGYALWTYDGDRRPGDMNGNDTFNYVFTGEPGQAGEGHSKSVDLGTPMDGAPALYWAIAVP